jgi:TAG lipase/steryl ester hydrolase/phospholipase A2/LPA acyltransferase
VQPIKRGDELVVSTDIFCYCKLHALTPLRNVLMWCLPQGELAIWEKLSAIETNCTIEATLDACLARLTNKARERPLNGLSSRIPSWLSMNTIGQRVGR